MGLQFYYIQCLFFLYELSEEEQAFCQEAVSNYNSFKEILWEGDLYRLLNPYENNYGSFQFVDERKERSIIFSYLVNERYQIDYSVEPILLKGLDPDKRYRVKELNLFPGTETTINEELTYSGAYLMQIGFNPKVGARRRSVVLALRSLE